MSHSIRKKALLLALDFLTFSKRLKCWIKGHHTVIEFTIQETGKPIVTGMQPFCGFCHKDLSRKSCE
jgi:hypothetical protein